MNRLLAQVNIGEEFKINSDGIAKTTGYESLGRVVSFILPNILLVAGLILFFIILFSGFTIITAGGDSEKMSQGSKTLTAAVAGFAIIIFSYWIMEIIKAITEVAIGI
jgi:hypothetical protein